MGDRHDDDALARPSAVPTPRSTTVTRSAPALGTTPAAGSPPVAETFDARVGRAEERPLEERAEAFARLHDELRTRLDGGAGV